MKVTILTKKYIKPATRTPPNLRRYKLSALDELIPPMNMSVILFYPPNPKPDTKPEPQQTLPHILTRFYPFAGRYLQNNLSIDCNDEGAEFVEAELPGLDLATFLSKTEKDGLDCLLSRTTYEADNPDDPILSVQITNFPECGGRAVGISLSHRVSDASSLGTFVSAWAHAEKKTVVPTFEGTSIFPSTGLAPQQRVQGQTQTRKTEGAQTSAVGSVAVRGLRFGREAVSRLRSELGPESRVRLASAFVAKALLKIELAKDGRACYLGQGVNMRSRTVPPLGSHACGNFVYQAVVRCMEAGGAWEPGLDELVRVVGGSIEKAVGECGRVMLLDGERRVEMVRRPLEKLFEMGARGENFVAIWFTDWSKFGFYEADFGWGKPVWVRVGNVRTENLTILMEDREGGGIEAWVHLSHEDVPAFESDDDIKLFLVA
ncbi:HXXXD-type acyl-transferase family protein [Striga asiatica]|uniref:HXXXD-type acyl-transferase family protein n=1 Tax=Striga asiatica TaxID=4170 RepID=A0A5A7Q5F7_STRAF|nr:HXXXD-type acyl-transferase family protein [Striga asiatica]